MIDAQINKTPAVGSLLHGLKLYLVRPIWRYLAQEEIEMQDSTVKLKTASNVNARGRP